MRKEGEVVLLFEKVAFDVAGDWQNTVIFKLWHRTPAVLLPHLVVEVYIELRPSTNKCIHSREFCFQFHCILVTLEHIRRWQTNYMHLQRQCLPLLVINHFHQWNHVINNSRTENIKHVKRIHCPRYINVLFFRLSVQLLAKSLAQLKHKFEDWSHIHRQVEF